MANAFLSATEYSNVMLLLLKNNLVMGRLVSGTFKNQVTNKNGLTINIKRPPQFVVKDGATLALQDIISGSTNVSVNQYKNVHVGVTDLEAVANYDELLRNATMKSAASALAHNVDLFLHGLLRDFASHVGDAGEDLTTPAQFMRAHTRLMEQSVPDTDLTAVMSYGDAAAIRGTLTEGNIQGVNRTALESARVPLMSSIQAYATQHIKSITAGTRSAAAGAVDGSGQSFNYRDVKDLDSVDFDIDTLGANATIAKGEIFTIAGVFAINNRSGETLPYLRQFVVTEDVTADGAGAATVPIWPAPIVPGSGGAGEADVNTAFGTVNAAPADGALLTFLGAAGSVQPIRAAWNKQAIQLVSVKLETPMSDTSSFATDPETGISIRYWRGSDITSGEHIHRWDMIYGGKVVDPRLGVRFSGDTPP